MVTAWLVAFAVLAAPVLAMQKLDDAKFRENYRAAAAFAGPEGPGVDTVIFGRNGALGVPIAYPEPFRDVAQPNRVPAGPDQELFGRTLGRNSLSSADVRDKRVALYEFIGFETPFERWLERHGCTPTTRFRDSRVLIVLYQC